MILLTSQFSENFENSRNEESMIQENYYEKNGYDSCFAGDSDRAKMYHEEYVEVFSPTVFETVEVYTSSCSSEKSENSVDLNADSSFADADTGGSKSDAVLNEISLNSIDTVGSLENLQPGTYTLDVLEPADFDFDAVFVDPAAAGFASELAAFGEHCRADETDAANRDAAEKTGECGASKKAYKLKTYRNNSSRKPLPTKYPPTKNVSAREFVNSFSSELRKNETSSSRSAAEDEGRSLTWLLDFKISSIFHPVEADTPEKGKKKSNDTQRKPRYTYTELIEQALKENGELTVSGIYNWISNHYPYYQQHDDRWKNSVRHNLSINPQFRKGKKASQGAGHFWNISDSAIQCSELNNKERNNKTETNSMSDLMNQIDEEVLAATRSIQETENLSFADVNLHEAANHLSEMERKSMETSFVNITRTDLEQLWESTQDTTDQRFTSFSPLIREITEESGLDDENFLIQDIHNSICLGDELFGCGLSSPYHGLTTI